MKEASQAVVNVGLVGHVDHGKTTLTKALSGKWSDTFSEELKRGISIRLGYADITVRKCPECKGANAYTTKEECTCGEKTKEDRKISLVDAPGHETLMATMISGAAILDGAILVIAANEECPQPQTEEHLEALRISGIKNLIVAQNKIDLVKKDQALKNHAQIKKFLEGKGYSNAPIIPVSANLGTNVDALLEAIETVIPTPERDLKSPLKMQVARSFEVNRPGTTPDKLLGAVLGGSISQGVVRVGDEIEICPPITGGPVTALVESINTEKGQLKEGRPGGLLAISTSLDPSLAKSDRLKGSVIGKVGSLPEPAKAFDARITLMERAVGGKVTMTPFKAGEMIVVAAGTGVTSGKIAKSRPDGQEFMASIELTRELCIEKGQRLVLSRNTGQGWRLSGYGIAQ